MQTKEMLNLLPQILRQTAHPGSPLEAILKIMEELHKPAEEILSSQDTLFDPRRTRENLVTLLAHWINLEWLVQSYSINSEIFSENRSFLIERLRELIANGAFLSKWRGTAPGLQVFISIALGDERVRVVEHSNEDADNPIPFHIVVDINSAFKKFDSLIHQIIKKEKPIYVTYEVRYS
ncbi:phage tail protein [Chitinispirillales bacterium ANBcel5]|uniref:phage tail protein n=1 Tax=Cellulosispirillum alkaliphilum TaxID=3039283 RepID=UPI002A4F2610|nr:phage tail protein [Chitinispirillales bacterium ANBcel5]